MMFSIEEVCGGKGLVEIYLSSLYLIILIIMHWALDLPQGDLHGGVGGGAEEWRVLHRDRLVCLTDWGRWGEHWWTWSGYGIHRTQRGWGS
jgi:hypothetical protein